MATLDIGLPPSITGTDAVSLQKLGSYIFQLVQQLNVALRNLDASNFSVDYQEKVAALTDVR